MEYQSLSKFIYRYAIGWTWLLLLAMIVAANIAYLTSSMLTPIYLASTTLLVEKAPGSQSDDYTAILTSELLTQTYAEMVTTRPVIDETISRLHLDMDVESLLETINVNSLRDTRLIELQVEHSNPSQAALIANTIIEVLSEYNQGLQDERYAASKQSLQEQLEKIDEQIMSASDRLNDLEGIPENIVERDRLETLLTDYQKSYIPLLQSFEEIRVLEASNAKIIQLGKAVPPDEFIRPRIWLNTILAAIIGLMLAAGTVYLLESLDDTIKYPDEITQQFGIPILGMIAQHNNEDKGPITLTTTLSPVAESFRILRESIPYLDDVKPINSLVLTSASDRPGAGSSSVAANLSIVFAQANKKVVLIDSDFRKPEIHDIFDLPNTLGFIDLIKFKNINISNVSQQSDIANLFIISSGRGITPPFDLFNSDKFKSHLKSLESHFDLVVIDTAPVILVSDVIALSREVDGVVIVVKPEHTNKSSLRKIIEQYTNTGIRILGIIINGYKPSRLISSHYKGDYYYKSMDLGNGASEEKPKRKYFPDKLWVTLDRLIYLIKNM